MLIIIKNDQILLIQRRRTKQVWGTREDVGEMGQVAEHGQTEIKRNHDLSVYLETKLVGATASPLGILKQVINLVYAVSVLRVQESQTRRRRNGY